MILRDEAQIVVDHGQQEADALENVRDKDKKIKIMGDRFKAAYDGIDASLVDIRTTLADVDTRFSMELLEYQNGRLETLENQIKATDNVAHAMAALDLDQTIVSAEDKEKRKTDAEIALGRCQTMVLARKALIQEKIAADQVTREAAERAVRLTATMTAMTVAPVKRGPKLEALSLPDFKGGKLKDYAKFRRD